MWVRIGVYLRAKAIVMAIVGAVRTCTALLLIGVPFAIPLAIIVAFGEIIPRAGPWLARIPLLSIAALDGPRTFLLTLVASIVIENAKGYVISPFVEGDQLEIDRLLVFVAVLVGATLGGFAGAFVAVPAAAIVDILVQDVVVPGAGSSSNEASDSVRYLGEVPRPDSEPDGTAARGGAWRTLGSRTSSKLGRRMYARVATFERIPPGRRRDRDGSRGGRRRHTAGLEGAKMLMLVNRETGKGLGVTLFESEEAMRRGDEALNAMNPGSSERRTSVEFFEVPVQTVS